LGEESTFWERLETAGQRGGDKKVEKWAELDFWQDIEKFREIKNFLIVWDPMGLLKI
jgi:hypothetical protein